MQTTPTRPWQLGFGSYPWRASLWGTGASRRRPAEARRLPGTVQTLAASIHRQKNSKTVVSANGHPIKVDRNTTPIRRSFGILRAAIMAGRMGGSASARHRTLLIGLRDGIAYLLAELTHRGFKIGLSANQLRAEAKRSNSAGVRREVQPAAVRNSIVAHIRRRGAAPGPPE